MAQVQDLKFSDLKFFRKNPQWLKIIECVYHCHNGINVIVTAGDIQYSTRSIDGKYGDEIESGEFETFCVSALHGKNNQLVRFVTKDGIKNRFQGIERFEVLRLINVVSSVSMSSVESADGDLFFRI